MKKIVVSFLILFNISIYGSDRTTEIYLSLSKKADKDIIYPISEFEIISKREKKTVSDILDKSPSVIMRENTQNFGLALPSIRGFSSNQTVVVYDGIKLPKDITSTYDLSILPDTLIDKIYLLKGGWSSVFGANAEGGVIALKTKDLDTTSIEFGSDFGSFNSERYYFRNTTVKDNISFVVDASNYQSDGFQQNSKANKNSISSKFEYKFNENSLINLSLFAVDLKRGLPSGTPVDISKFNGKREKKANSLTDWQKDKNLFGSVGYSLKFDDLKTEIRYSRSDLLRDAYQFSSLTRIKTYSNNFISKLNSKYINLGVEYEENILRSNSYGDHEMKTIGYFADKGFEISNNLHLNIYIRYDDSKNYDDILSPKAVFKYFASDKFLFSYSVSKSWRAPNFGDIYGAPAYWYDPNPDIKPEKSLSNEMSLSYLGKIKPSFSFYYYSIDDKITIYTDPNTWISKSVNLAEGYIKGIELSVETKINQLDLFAGINMMDVKGKNKNQSSYKKLAYSPDMKFSGSIKYEKDFASIEFRNIYVSKQWSGINKTGKKIPSYSVSSVSLAKNIKNIDLKFSVENLFNERYATTADSFNGYYPANPRTYSFLISSKF